MSGCDRFEGLIEEYLGGGISPGDLEMLERHAASCPACGKIIELHRQLSGVPDAVPEATEEDFGAMRAAVLERITAAGKTRDTEPFWRRWMALAAAGPGYAVAFTALLIALGFFIGRISPGQPEFEDDLLVQEVIRQASLGRGLEGYWESPFTYSNVDLRPQTGGRAILSFDVTRRFDVETSLDSPLTREVLVYAMIDPSNMGSRFEAMAVAERSMDERLKDGLVFILLNDPSMPVRLKSLDILSQHASDPVVQEALLVSVSQDPSVQVRLLALESLADHEVAPDVIRRAIGDTPDESGRAVLNRAIELTSES
jgi:hypothetical protein